MHRVDPDGVRITEKRRGTSSRVRWIIPVLGVVIGVVGMLLLHRETAAPVAQAPARPAAHSTLIAKAKTAPSPLARPESHASHQTDGRRKDESAPRPESQAGALNTSPAQVKRAAEAAEEQARVEDIARGMIEAAAAASGKREGLAAFPPPGTNPIKLGIVVPDDYQLPDGYMRHYQTTDDGRRLEPILMFSPDYEFVDAQGNPVQLPPDGVVPIEMAPPDLKPLRMLEMPEHPYGSGLGAR
jgi:hypothetical protein